MNRIEDELGPEGFVSRKRLLARGLSDRRIAKAIAEGQIQRVRNGWFASKRAADQDVRAVTVGGRLTCVSLAEQLGLWTHRDPRLHVAMPRNAARSRRPDNRHVRLGESDLLTVRHWGAPLIAADPTSSRDSLMNAMIHLVRCQPLATAIVTIDSALNGGLLTGSSVREIVQALPRSKQKIVDMVDGSSQSGLETMCRLSLRSKHLVVTTQARIDGVGFVDVLVGDRLVIELDGRRFHNDPTSFANDRRRDLELAARGYRTLRLSYEQVMFDWPNCEDAILRLVRAGEHQWRESSLKYFR